MKNHFRRKRSFFGNLWRRVVTHIVPFGMADGIMRDTATDGDAAGGGGNDGGEGGR